MMLRKPVSAELLDHDLHNAVFQAASLNEIFADNHVRVWERLRVADNTKYPVSQFVSMGNERALPNLFKQVGDIADILAAELDREDNPSWSRAPATVRAASHFAVIASETAIRDDCPDAVAGKHPFTDIPKAVKTHDTLVAISETYLASNPQLRLVTDWLVDRATETGHDEGVAEVIAASAFFAIDQGLAERTIDRQVAAFSNTIGNSV